MKETRQEMEKGFQDGFEMIGDCERKKITHFAFQF